MSDKYPILSNQNLTSGATLKKAAVAVPVTLAVLWLAPWWLIAAGVGGAGYYGYKKLNGGQ